jgi:hypothetical protein
MPVKRSGSVAALPPAAGRRARARLCLRLAAPLSFLLLLAVLLRTQPLLGVPPDAPPPAAGPAKVAFLFLVRAAVPLDFLWDAFFRVSTGGSLFSLSLIDPFSLICCAARSSIYHPDWLIGGLIAAACLLSQNGEEGRFSVYVHSAPGFHLDRTTTGSPYFYGRQLARSVKVGPFGFPPFLNPS